MNNRPFDLLNDSLGKPVLVELKGNVSFRGIMKAFDVHMNILLEEAEKLEDNVVKSKYGKILLRGDNVLLISPWLLLNYFFKLFFLNKKIVLRSNICVFS